MAVEAVACRGISVALACRTFSISESCYRYERQLSDENAEIAEWPSLGHVNMPCRSKGETDQQPPDVGLWTVFFVFAKREGL